MLFIRVIQKAGLKGAIGKVKYEITRGNSIARRFEEFNA